MKIEIDNNIVQIILGLMYVEVCAVIGAVIGWELLNCFCCCNVNIYIY